MNHDSCQFEEIEIKNAHRRVAVLKHLDRLIDEESGDASCLALFLHYLTVSPDVVSIHVAPKFKLHNTEAAWITQSAQEDFTPLYDQGITGNGQVVGILDSGADQASCFLRDDANGFIGAVPHTQPNLGASSTNLGYRKVVQYIYLNPGGDSSDTAKGHGTHVVGTAVGSMTGIPTSVTCAAGQYESCLNDCHADCNQYGTTCQNLIDTCRFPFQCSQAGPCNEETLSQSLRRGNGIAYDAKVAFFDG